MATLVLGVAGAAIGGSIGGAILGVSAATIGGFIGSTVGSVVDSWIVSSLAPTQRIEGARLDSLRITSATEGAILPRRYGRMRMGGNIIWATDFREEINRGARDVGGPFQVGRPTLIEPTDDSIRAGQRAARFLLKIAEELPVGSDVGRDRAQLQAAMRGISFCQCDQHLLVQRHLEQLSAVFIPIILAVILPMVKRGLHR